MCPTAVTVVPSDSQLTQAAPSGTRVVPSSDTAAYTVPDSPRVRYFPSCASLPAMHRRRMRSYRAACHSRQPESPRLLDATTGHLHEQLSSDGGLNDHLAATGSRASALSASDATPAPSSPQSPASSRDLGELNASRKAHSVADGGGTSSSPSALTSSPFSSETEMSVHDWPMIKELSRALKHGRSGAMRQWAKVGAGVPPPSDDGSDGDDGDAHVLQHELITAFNEDKGSEKRWSGVAELLAATRVDETEAAVQQLKAQGAEPLDIAKLAPENSPLRGHELAALLDGSELKIRVRFLCKLPPWYYPHPLRLRCVCWGTSDREHVSACLGCWAWPLGLPRSVLHAGQYCRVAGVGGSGRHGFRFQQRGCTGGSGIHWRRRQPTGVPGYLVQATV